MAYKSIRKSLVQKVAPERVLDQSTEAFKAYDTYKKAAEIIERTEVAAGKRVAFKSGTGSTINFEIDRHGVSSTTAQKI